MTVTTGKGIKAEERVRRLLLGARQYVHEIKDLQRRLNEIERNIQLAQEGIRVFGGANGRGAQPARAAMAHGRSNRPEKRGRRISGGPRKAVLSC